MAEIITRQMNLFLISMAYGFLLGIWYDIFRVFREKITHKNKMVHMEDIIFCFSAAGGLFVLFQVYNQGVIRFYVLVGLEIGTLLYFFLFSQFIKKGIGILWELLLLATGLLWKGIGNPAKLIVKSILNMLKKLIRTVRIVKSRK